MRCELQPCLSACPVNAFDDKQYDVQSCFDYLAKGLASSCHKSGCQARNACPEGANFQYTEDHRRFHMEQFYTALYKRYGDKDAQ